MLPRAATPMVTPALMPVPICWPALNARDDDLSRRVSNLSSEPDAFLSAGVRWSSSPSDARRRAVSAMAIGPPS
jgi:hypothetical protein